MTYRFMVYSFSFALFFLSTLAFAQTPEPQNMAATCTFEDGRSLTVRYSNVNTERKRDLQNGKVWSPGNFPMLLFTEAPVNIEGIELAVGAYSMYVIPDKSKWTLIMNKNITQGSEYDEKQDIVRTAMGLGQLPMATDQPRVSLNHIAPKVCSLRVDFGKTGAWADVFMEK